MKTRRTFDEITAQNQATCKVFYATARKEFQDGNLEDSLFWQNGAAAHFVKTAYRMFPNECINGVTYVVQRNYWAEIHHLNGRYFAYVTIRSTNSQFIYIHADYNEICNYITTIHENMQ